MDSENSCSTAYPPFAVTVDVVVLTVLDRHLEVALIERGNDPFRGALALPGGFVEPNEDLAAAAVRELSEETGLVSPPDHLEQLAAYGDPGRDPRMRVVTVAYWAIVANPPDLRGGSDAAKARLMRVGDALAESAGLAFDHHKILGDALLRARVALEHTTIATRFCLPEFTVGDLRAVYEAVWGTNLDPGNFQKRVIETPAFVEPVGRLRRGSRGRPAKLYRAGPGQLIDPPLRRPGVE